MMTRMPWAVALAGLAALAPAANAQPTEYRTEVIARDLDRPTGIAVDLRGNLFFTELPTPGVPGGMGGRNTVSKRLPRTGEIVTLTEGEPEPTNLAVTLFGEAYWTCKSAGVILSIAPRATDAELVVGDLDKPSGITTDLFGRVVYFTEVPTPGVPGNMGGLNGVFALVNGVVRTLNDGEPEPSDIVRTLDGTLYWTCTTAGVILKRTRDGEVSLLLDELDHPVGITADWLGNLYFTEVPTPGVSGRNGGRNKVWRYDLRRDKLTLVDEGDPEPRDITSTPFGTLFWTCTSAGVIVQATPE